MTPKMRLIEDILRTELEMFLSVPTLKKVSCQDHPELFWLHRKAQFSVWSVSVLKSYHGDLTEALEMGKNLMTIKYARMDNLIPRENHNPLIERIAAIQCEWQKEMFKKHPRLLAGARPLSHTEDSIDMTSFETYLKGELETYSDKTLSLLYEEIVSKVNKGINLSSEVYDFLVKELGYRSIEEAELARS